MGERERVGRCRLHAEQRWQQVHEALHFRIRIEAAGGLHIADALLQPCQPLIHGHLVDDPARPVELFQGRAVPPPGVQPRELLHHLPGRFAAGAYHLIAGHAGRHVFQQHHKALRSLVEIAVITKRNTDTHSAADVPVEADLAPVQALIARHLAGVFPGGCKLDDHRSRRILCRLRVAEREPRKLAHETLTDANHSAFEARNLRAIEVRRQHFLQPGRGEITHRMRHGRRRLDLLIAAHRIRSKLLRQVIVKVQGAELRPVVAVVKGDLRDSGVVHEVLVTECRCRVHQARQQMGDGCTVADEDDVFLRVRGAHRLEHVRHAIGELARRLAVVAAKVVVGNGMFRKTEVLQLLVGHPLPIAEESLDEIVVGVQRYAECSGDVFGGVMRPRQRACVHTVIRCRPAFEHFCGGLRLADATIVQRRLRLTVGDLLLIAHGLTMADEQELLLVRHISPLLPSYLSPWKVQGLNMPQFFGQLTLRGARSTAPAARTCLLRRSSPAPTPAPAPHPCARPRVCPAVAPRARACPRTLPGRCLPGR